MNVLRRHFVAGTIAGITLFATGAVAATGTMAIYKDAQCGCCEQWAEAMEAAGYKVEVRDEADMSVIKTRFAVPADMEGCHTAVIDGYVIEGHVPLEAVKKLLAERPDVAGIAVPGMPSGSLGMGNDPQASYDVYTIAKAGAQPTVYYQVRPAN
ncbi:DUF411 domain-containing protein [Ensifer adhaerens]|uniref:DUF411 domain-containing protein n=1 Tax=Ensifer adhaerens TaxID=106592 RepID=UPI001CBE5DFF|nr:DUF411 domain-containing protein [Ensifer adhaerens]MBZ7925311.1 DUF411 domain-containing protein [Ensifer adhaerens]UAX95517.1 DUF411 domain-containing protein [Ensifer adhaerens]UAY02591.1 DUF411 domain-containing protein [Ensifer adhaerens]UAY10575.1 DUF411 domain-containing protein [Ensifer adhaerens]